MKRLFFSTAALAAAFAPFPAHALTITIDAETLRDAAGALFPTAGLIVLTAATEGTFLGPTPTSFTTGSEIEIARWDLSAWATPGALSDSTTDLFFSGAWDEGDPLRLYWYPTLTIDSLAPISGAAYGEYSDLFGIDESDPWITPAESGVLNLHLGTTDASALLLPGSLAPAVGQANQVVAAVVPEPGTAVYGLATIAVLALRRRRN